MTQEIDLMSEFESICSFDPVLKRGEKFSPQEVHQAKERAKLKTYTFSTDNPALLKR